MGTVVAVATRGGVAIAGDRQAVDDGTITGQRVHRVVDTDTVGAGIVGEPADVQAFRRALKGELRRLRIEQDGEVGIEKLGRIAARLAERSNVAAVIAGYDEHGVPRLREVGPDGGLFEQTAVALGDGRELAAGQLEAVDSDLGIEDTVTTVAEILEHVAARDTRSGGDIDLWSLSHAPASESSNEY